MTVTAHGHSAHDLGARTHRTDPAGPAGRHSADVRRRDPDVTREATDRLLAEFGPVVDRTVVADVVQDCHQDLRGAPAGALPELVERLARQRLRESLHVEAAAGASVPTL